MLSFIVMPSSSPSKVRMSVLIRMASFLMSCISSAPGATLVSYSFPSTNSLVATTQAGNTTSTNFSLSSGSIETNITTGAYFPNEPYIEESSWTATSRSTAKYFYFTIVAAVGYTIDITNVSFNAYATGAGPTALGVTVGSSSFGTINTPDSSLFSVSQPVTGNTGLSSVEIRIEGWLDGSRSSTGSGVLRIDDFVVAGNVVPEPSSLVFLGASGLLGLLRRRR
jgi:hypothetical protein